MTAAVKGLHLKGSESTCPEPYFEIWAAFVPNSSANRVRKSTHVQTPEQLLCMQIWWTKAN